MSQNAEEQPGTTTPPISSDATTDSTETVTQDIKPDISDVSVQPSDIKTTTAEEPLRRSQRISRKTDNMADYLAEEGRKRERRLMTLYDRWRLEVMESRKALKSSISEEELGKMIDRVSDLEKQVIDQF